MRSSRHSGNTELQHAHDPLPPFACVKRTQRWYQTKQMERKKHSGGRYSVGHAHFGREHRGHRWVWSDAQRGQDLKDAFWCSFSNRGNGEQTWEHQSVTHLEHHITKLHSHNMRSHAMLPLFNAQTKAFPAVLHTVFGPDNRNLPQQHNPDNGNRLCREWNGWKLAKHPSVHFHHENRALISAKGDVYPRNHFSTH